MEHMHNTAAMVYGYHDKKNDWDLLAGFQTLWFKKEVEDI